MPVYALNLFNAASREEYMAYSRRSAREVQAHGGKVVALGKYRQSMAGDADLHPHREKGAKDYIWHMFDKLEDLRPIFKSSSGSGA